MGSYFHITERKAGGNLDAFYRELGRIRENGHLHYARHGRTTRITETVGFDHAVHQCLVDTGHSAGCEVHALASTGIVLVFNARSGKLVTVFVVRPGQAACYYEPLGEDVPDWLMNRAYENTCVCHLNYQEKGRERHHRSLLFHQAAAQGAHAEAQAGHGHRRAPRRIEGSGGGVVPTGDAGLCRARVPTLGDARLLPQSERYTEGRYHPRD